MARKKVSTPMLEAFLREAPSKDFGVWPQWLEWVAGGGTALLLMSVQVEFIDKSKLWAFLIGGAVWYGFHFCRNQQIARLDSRKKIHFERWTHVQRLRHILLSGARLGAYLPVQVSEQLEACARARMQVIEDIRLSTTTDPEIIERVRTEVDEDLALAIASAAIVTRRDDQGMKELKQWEADEALMAPILRRIAVRRERLETLAHTSLATPDSASSLREMLATAQAEREAAERELDESLRQL